ncbi:MAG TPA: aromatic aminobenezylarsenical efflux permease ArsG family transporter, partial [Bacteroidales bacterium]|nr:aromatic aminobenezylarsenical efflux permease ArsG family transporter [Bacteroidales bacterium]
FISKDIKNRTAVFYNGLIYTLGRALSYTLLAFILYLGADELEISWIFQQYGEKILGPMLVIIGLFMLGVIKLSFGGLLNISGRFQNKDKHSYLDVLLLGIVFALAFCPYSGVLYFGMLIPMTIQSTSGLILPVVFAIATGVPVIIFAWLLAFTVSGVGKFYNRITLFEVWFRRVVAALFIGVGIYYILIIWII